jgi:hypothetical protein
MRNVSDKSCRQNKNTYFIPKNFISKIMPFMRHVEKCGGARQATDDNTTHARCMLST